VREMSRWNNPQEGPVNPIYVAEHGGQGNCGAGKCAARPHID